MRSALVFALACSLLSAKADTPTIRVKLRAEADHGLTEMLAGAMSREFRRLETVLVTEDSPHYQVSCSVITVDSPEVGFIGYAASVAVSSSEGQLLGNFVHVDPSLESLAHEVAVTVNGAVFERVRKASATEP